MVEFFLESGEKLEGPEWNDFSYTHCIFKRKNISVRKDLMLLLIKYGLHNKYLRSAKQSLLHMFINYTRKEDLDAVEVAEILLNSGVGVNDYDFIDSTALHNSVTVKHVPLVSFLISKGADVNYKDQEGETPLHYAVGSIEIADLLLKGGADINARDLSGKTVLHRAFQIDKEETISLLVRKGASISVKDEKGRAPFHLLHRNEDNGCIEAMVKEFSKLVFGNLPVSKADMELIQGIPMLQKHFENSTKELNQMQNTKFYGNYSYYSVLKVSEKNMNKLAHLAKNKEFVSKFEENLRGFLYYENALKQIMIESMRVRNELEVIESRLNSVFGDYLPAVVIRKLVDNLSLKDLPLE